MRDEKERGGRGMGVALGYDDLAGMYKILLCILTTRGAPRRSSRRLPKKEKGNEWKTKERALGLYGRPRHIQEIGSKKGCRSVRLTRLSLGLLVSPLLLVVLVSRNIVDVFRSFRLQ